MKFFFFPPPWICGKHNQCFVTLNGYIVSHLSCTIGVHQGTKLGGPPNWKFWIFKMFVFYSHSKCPPKTRTIFQTKYLTKIDNTAIFVPAQYNTRPKIKKIKALCFVQLLKLNKGKYLYLIFSAKGLIYRHLFFSSRRATFKMTIWQYLSP